MLRIRLRRVGKKKAPAYRVVVADSRSPRDGRFVEVLGLYDPLTEPATVRIDLEKAKDWMRKGAQPSDTVARLLRTAGMPAASVAAPAAAATAVAEPPAAETAETAAQSEEPEG